jgi:ABC-type glycerol-3-phosphate transport system permease component
MVHAMNINRRQMQGVLVFALQIIIAIAVLMPFFWMFSVSLKPATEPFAIPARLWPQHPTLDNYASAFRPEFQRYFLNGTACSAGRLQLHPIPNTPSQCFSGWYNHRPNVSIECHHHPDLYNG